MTLTSSIKFCPLKQGFVKAYVYRQCCYLLHGKERCFDFEVIPKRRAENFVVSSQNRESVVRRAIMYSSEL